MLDKIRKILMRRMQNTTYPQFDPVFSKNDPKDLEEISERLKKLELKIIAFQSCFRSEDDRLILTLFEAQSEWHDLTVELNKTLIKSNERISELEKLIRVVIKK